MMRNIMVALNRERLLQLGNTLPVLGKQSFKKYQKGGGGGGGHTLYLLALVYYRHTAPLESPWYTNLKTNDLQIKL